MDSLRPRLLPIVGLLAVIPVVVYGLDGSAVVVLSLVSVLIVLGSLYYLFSPVDGADVDDGNDRDDGPGTPG